MDLSNINEGRKARKKNSLDVSSMMYGKIPPQAKSLEEAVLGTILSHKEAFDIVSEYLRPECFYLEAHQRIFRAMQHMAQSNSNIDLLTVIERLRFTEELDLCGGPFYLSKMVPPIPSSAHIEDHSKIIIQKFIQREIIRIGGEMVGDAYEDSADAFELIEKSEKAITGLNPISKHTYERLDNLLVASMKKIEELMNSDKRLTGVATGLTDLDRLTCGWQQPDLIVLAARPSVGKTCFALNLAMNAARVDKIPVGFFSMEMSKAQLIQRMLSTESRIPLGKISRGQLTVSELEDLYKLGTVPLSKLNIYIDDTPALTIIELRNKARKMVKDNNVKLFFVDYIQLMSGVQNNRADNREQEISKISRDLKGLAKELEVPVIALSQLSREVEKRKEKMPVLSDLRESGAIEQDADIVMFMYRPDYYEIHVNEHGENTNGETLIKFSKHRSGPLDTVRLMANLTIQRFDNFMEVKQLGLNGKPGNPNFNVLPKEENYF